MIAPTDCEEKFKHHLYYSVVTSTSRIQENTLSTLTQVQPTHICFIRTSKAGDR